MSDRIDAFLARLERLSIDDLQVLVPPAADPVERDAVLDRVEGAAGAAGRLDELDEAADRARSAIVGALSFRGYDPTFFGLNWGRSWARSPDRMVLIEAVEDAAMAAVVADLLPDDAAALAERFEVVASMRNTAPATHPTSREHPTIARAIVLLAFVGFIAGAAISLTDLVADVVDGVGGCGNLLSLQC